MSEKKLHAVKEYDPAWPGPFCTRDGMPVRLLTKTEGSKDFPVVGFIATQSTPSCWSEFGSFLGGISSDDLNLMCAEEIREPREFWIAFGNVYKSLEEAKLDYAYEHLIVHVREVLEGE